MDELKLQLQADRKNTLYNETQRAATNAKSKMYFSRHSQGSFHSILNKAGWFPGEGAERFHIWAIRGYVYQPLASLTLEKVMKITLHLLEH